MKGHNYTLQFFALFILCKEAKKNLNSLQRNKENAKENFTNKNHFKTASKFHYFVALN